MLEPVAVFVPSYNHATFIESCLRSIYAQTYEPSTLLVIDDGSTDNSPEIITRVLEDCPFPSEFIARAHKGLPATLNEALGRTTEPLIAYVGADDRWHPDRLRVAAEAFSANPSVVMSYSDCLMIDADDRVLGRGCFNTHEGRRLHVLKDRRVVCDLEGLLRARTIPLMPTVTYRRKAVAQFGWTEASWVEDYEMYILLATIGPFHYIPRALGFWRLHGSQLSSRVDANMIEAQKTQQRLAGRLGLSEKRLKKYQASVRFVWGEYFLRHGEWRRGTAVTLRNLHAAPSAAVLLERLARILLVPTLIHRARRLLRRSSAQ